MITNDDILEYAVANGFNFPTENALVHRGVTAPLAGSKDLGEWWISCPGTPQIFVVKDEALQRHLRENKLKELGL